MQRIWPSCLLQMRFISPQSRDMVCAPAQTAVGERPRERGGSWISSTRWDHVDQLNRGITPVFGEHLKTSLAYIGSRSSVFSAVTVLSILIQYLVQAVLVQQTASASSPRGRTTDAPRCEHERFARCVFVVSHLSFKLQVQPFSPA